MKDYIKGSIAGTVLMALWCWYWLSTPSIKEDKPEWPSQKEAYRAWRATNGTLVALPIYSFKDTDTLRLSERGKEVLRINADRTVYTFINTNCELVCVDTNGVKWTAKWEREFTNDWKWSDPGTNKVSFSTNATGGMLDQPVTGDGHYSFYPMLGSGFYQPASNTVGVVWRGSNIFTFKGKLNDANLYGPTNVPTYMEGYREGRKSRQKEIEFMLRDYIK